MGALSGIGPRWGGLFLLGLLALMCFGDGVGNIVASPATTGDNPFVQTGAPPLSWPAAGAVAANALIDAAPASHVAVTRQIRATAVAAGYVASFASHGLPRHPVKPRRGPDPNPAVLARVVAASGDSSFPIDDSSSCSDTISSDAAPPSRPG